MRGGWLARANVTRWYEPLPHPHLAKIAAPVREKLLGHGRITGRKDDGEKANRKVGDGTGAVGTCQRPRRTAPWPLIRTLEQAKCREQSPFNWPKVPATTAQSSDAAPATRSDCDAFPTETNAMFQVAEVIRSDENVSFNPLARCKNVDNVTSCRSRAFRTGGAVSRMSATSVWSSDLESLAEVFWLPYRNALREDLPGAMSALHTTNLGFAQRIEGMDRRQVEAFARALGPVRVLSIREGSAERCLNSAPGSARQADSPTWPWLGALTVQYLILGRNGLNDRRHLAIEQFGMQSDLFISMLSTATAGDLLARQDDFSKESVLELLVTVSMEVLADRVLNGACQEELRMCRMAHAASINNQLTMRLGMAA